MNKNLKRLTLLALTVVVMAGCSKKVTKVEPTPPPPPPPPPPAPVVVEPPPPVEPTIDTAAIIRNALSSIYFDYDKSDLKPEAISALENAARVLQQYSNFRVMAEGHADERGTAQYNMGLGEDRAKAVRNYLTSYGISSTRLEVTSYGKERPANPNCDGDDYCHSQNRRVEWRILN